MTLLYAFQGRNQALVASDLQLNLRFGGDNQPRMSLIYRKLHQNNHQDLIAFRGRLNTTEVQTLENLELKDLTSHPFTDMISVALERIGEIMYVDSKSGVVYWGRMNQPLRPMPRATLKISVDADQRLFEKLFQTSRDATSRTPVLNKGFFRGLARRIGEVLIAEEPRYPFIGGYDSYLVSRGKVERVVRRLGKLEGSKEACVSGGLVYFKE